MTFKRILALPYGSVAQLAAADAWYDRFAAWCERHPNFDAYYPRLWDSVHLTDVGALARRRWLYRQGSL